MSSGRMMPLSTGSKIISSQFSIVFLLISVSGKVGGRLYVKALERPPLRTGLTEDRYVLIREIEPLPLDSLMAEQVVKVPLRSGHV